MIVRYPEMKPLPAEYRPGEAFDITSSMPQLEWLADVTAGRYPITDDDIGRWLSRYRQALVDYVAAAMRAAT